MTYRVTDKELLKIAKKYPTGWKSICDGYTLSEEFIRKHIANIDMQAIAWHQKLSEAFIEEYKDVWDWEVISQCQRLSETFIHKHKDLVDWKMISASQNLSERFIEEHKDLVDWWWIFERQELSDEFRNKYKFYGGREKVIIDLMDKLISSNSTSSDIIKLQKLTKESEGTTDLQKIKYEYIEEICKKTGKVLCAAILVDDKQEHDNRYKLLTGKIKTGIVIVGRRHADTLPILKLLNIPADVKYEKWGENMQGFVTTKGIFVGRGLAKIIALYYNQIGETDNDALFSEDLY